MCISVLRGGGQGVVNSNRRPRRCSKLEIIDHVKTLQELIEIRDGYKECFGLTQEVINNFITNLCTK